MSELSAKEQHDSFHSLLKDGEACPFCEISKTIKKFLGEN